ncbi:MAG: FkbM family methyltransferase [Solirubrobacteraceae bacterium]
MPVGRAAKIAIKNAIGLKGMKQGKVLAGPARGVSMTFDFSGHTPMYLGMFEWELHRFFSTVLTGSRCVFDVGGYVGYDALMFAANSQGRVITFEPNPDQAQILRDNVAQNPDLQTRISVNPNAVGHESSAGVTTLDALSEEVGVPDFVKIDIDGGEFGALQGGATLLRERRPHLVVETHSLELEVQCGVFLQESGYKPVIKHNRKIWREHRAGALHNR